MKAAFLKADKMANTVCILGAGASKEAGAPLMAEFLDTARDLSVAKDHRIDSESHAAFERVFKAIQELRISHYKSYINLDDIEAVFGAFEMARLINRMGSYSPNDINELISSIKKLIVKTLEVTMKYGLSKGHIGPIHPYSSFTKLLEKLGSVSEKYASSVLTFNYDIALDHALYKQPITVDYGLSSDDAKGSFKLLKLHGSLNWGKCAKCESIVPYHMKQFFKKFSFPWYSDSTSASLDIGSKLISHEHCGTPLHPDPILVPPTWNKTEYHDQLGEVWAQAGKELSEAENIIVIGYSHPISDQFFKYLYALGSIGDATIRKFWVFDPAEGNQVETKYKALMGTGLNIRFRFFRETFSKAIDTLSSNLF